MKNEKTFNKYDKLGADYHHRVTSKKSLSSFNAYVDAKYEIEMKIIIFAVNQIKTNPLKILDIGCGDGVILTLINNRLKNHKINLYGVDNSDIAIKIAKNKIPDANLKIADVYNIPFNDNEFDIILSSDVIEHVSKPKKVLSEIKRIGKNNGILIIGTPIRFTQESKDTSHVHEFFQGEFQDLLKEYFYNVKLIQTHSLLSRLLYEKRVKLLGSRRRLFHYFFNFLSIYLNKNLFLKIKTDNTNIFSYMFGYCKILKDYSTYLNL